MLDPSYTILTQHASLAVQSGLGLVVLIAGFILALPAVVLALVAPLAGVVLFLRLCRAEEDARRRATFSRAAFPSAASEEAVHARSEIRSYWTAPRPGHA